MGLTAAAQDGGGDGVAERRGEHVAEALGTGAGVGTKVLDPAVAPEVDAGRAGRRAGASAGAWASDVNQASSRELNRSSTPRNAHSISSAGDWATTSVAARKRAIECAGLAGSARMSMIGVESSSQRHLVVDELSGVGEHRVGELS